jgi:hypothetical protein
MKNNNLKNKIQLVNYMRLTIKCNFTEFKNIFWQIS